MGDGLWAIVDSCIDRDNGGRPAALEFLEAIGLDVANQVVLIAATHWHDDHVKGLAAIVRSCPSARVVTSTALKSDEFFKTRGNL